MGSSIKAVAKIVTAPIKALYDPVGAFKDVFSGVQDIFAGLTGTGKVASGSSSEPSSQTVRSSKAPARFILGRSSTGGVLAWIQEQQGSQTNREWLHIVYVLSEGAIEGVDEIYVDEQPISTLGENATYEVLINPTQVNAFLLENCPDWRAEQIGRDLSFVRVSFKYDAEKFPSGIPDVRFVVRGRSDVYDPRNGQTKYSANTALLILWFLRNRCGIPDDEIIFESFASAANISDEVVTDPEGKTSARYFAGAVIGADEKRNAVLENLLSACAGTLIRVGGRWSLQVGAYYGPADFTITEDMVIGTVEGTTEISNSDAINTMRGTFVDPAQAWADTDYPEVAVQDWIAADGGELAESQSFSYVTDAYLAQRLANITLRRRRSGGSLGMPLNFNGYNCRPGRAVTVDLPSLNIFGEFIVTDWTMGAVDACKVTLKPYEQAIFDDAVGQPYNPLGFINLPVGGLAAVTNLVWTPSSVAEVVQGVLRWTPPAQTVLSYTVTIRKGTEVVQSLKVGGEASSCNINGLASGVYVMSVIAFGPGTRSGEASISVNVGGPPMPESCAVYASVNSITLVPANLQNSLNGGTYEYFHATNPSAPIADAVYLGQGLSFTHTGLAFAKDYFYYVRSTNAYGKSDFLYVPAATSNDPKQMLDVIAGEITESELGKELLSEIEKIELIDGNGPGSVNERLEVVKSELNEQVADVNNALAGAKSELQQQITAVDQEVDAARAELQQQIDAIEDLADSMPYVPTDTYVVGQAALGEDGKLYQAKAAVPANTPPPNATYWTDIGQAVQAANGLAARVVKVETDVATVDGKTTAQASQISGLQTSLTTTNDNVAKKADAAVVDSLTVRVSDAEGKLTSEGKRIDGLQTSLDGKASSTALQQVTSRVTATEQKDTAQDQQISSQSQALTSLTDTVSKKAEASTVQSLSNEVKQHGEDLTAQGQSLTRIDAALPNVGGENVLFNPSFDTPHPTAAWLGAGWGIGNNNATVSAYWVNSSLDPSGKAQRLEVTIPNAGAYVDLVQEVEKRPAASEGQVFALSAHTRGGGEVLVRLYVQWQDASGTTIGTTGGEAFTPSQNWERVQITTGAAPAGTALARVILRVIGPLNGAPATGFVEWDRAQLELGSTASGWKENGLVNAADAQANASATSALTGRVEKTEQGLSSASSQVTQLENSLTTTNGNVTTAQQAAQQALTEVAKKADASTVQSLSNTVAQQGQQITADGQAITRIDASIASSGSENLLFNPSFDNPSAGNVNTADGWTWRNTSGVSVTPTLRNSDLGAEGKCQRLDVAGLSADSSAQYVDFVPESSRRPPIYPGVAVTVSVYIRGSTGLMVQVYLQFKDAAGNTLTTNGPSNLNLNPSYQRPFLVSAVAPADSVRVDVLYRIRSGPGSSVTAGFLDFDMAQLEQGTTLTGWRDNGKANSSSIAVNAAATTALTGRVEVTERGLTSASGQLSQLENSIGDVGGENLFYNPAFTKYTSLNGSPEGWATEGPVTSTDTIVPSWLNSGEKAQRIVAPGLTSSNQYKSLRPEGSKRIKVSEGQAVNASVYARKISGDIGARIFIQWISANDAVLGAPSSDLTALVAAGARLSFSAVAPTGAIEAYVYFRTYAMTATATNGTVEYARPQAEYGTRATGWRDNGQVIAVQQTATSTAVDSLTSAVSQQDGKLSSVSDRTASLENAVNSTSGGLATKASAESVNSLGNRVKQTEEGLSSASSSVIDLRNSITAVEKAVGSASGLDPAPGANWQFDNGIEGWAVANANATVSNGVVRFTPTTSDPQFLSSNGPLSLSIPGAQYTKVRVGLTRRGGGASAWTGTLYYSTAAHGIVSSYRASAPNPNLAVGQSGVVEWDMASLAAGGTDWVDSTIGRLRINFANDVSSVWDIDWIAVGRVAPSASSRALSSLDSKVTQQGADLVAESKRVDGLYTSVGSTNAAVQDEVKARSDADSALSTRIDTAQAAAGAASAAVQSEATARANAVSAVGKRVDTVQSNLDSTFASVQRVSSTVASLDAVASASDVVKVQITANGIRHVAGFGIGIDNSQGVVQSTFAVLAGRFAILNPSGDAISSPFATQGNQSFLDDAFIRSASIGTAKIADAAITAAKIGVAEVDTLRIRGNAVTIPVGAFASSNTVTVTVTLDGNYPVFLLGTLTQTYNSNITMSRNGVALWVEKPVQSTIASRGVMDYPGPGTHTYTLSSDRAENTNGASILAVVCKR